MYTIKQIAQKLDITPQAVYKILNENKEQFKTCLKPIKQNGKTVKAVNRRGLEIIKGHFKQEVNNEFKTSFKTNLKPPNDETAKETIEFLREQLQEIRADYKEQLEVKDNQLMELKKDYKQQLQVKDNQIQELNERLKEQQELNRNNQILIGRGQDQKALPGGTVIDKIKNFFNKEG